MPGRWGAEARGWRVRQLFPGRKRNRCRRWGTTVPQRQGLDGSFRGEGTVSTVSPLLPGLEARAAGPYSARRPLADPHPTNTCYCYFSAHFPGDPKRVQHPNLLSLSQTPPFALRSSVSRSEAPGVRVHQTGRGKVEGERDCGTPTASEEGAAVPGAASRRRPRACRGPMPRQKLSPWKG